MGQRIRTGKRKHKMFRVIIVLLLILFFILSGYAVFENKLSKIISEMAENTVKAKAAIIISTAICEEIESKEITYDTLISFEKDANGRISALKTNIIEINRLKAKLSVKILEELANMDTAELSVPLGTVIGGDLMSGRGPGIKINVIPVGSVDTEIKNEISSAGINQSRHQVMMRVTAELTIITAVTSITTNVETYICIAETVIVGDVPGSYTNIGTNKKYT